MASSVAAAFRRVLLANRRCIDNRYDAAVVSARGYHDKMQILQKIEFDQIKWGAPSRCHPHECPAIPD